MVKTTPILSHTHNAEGIAQSFPTWEFSLENNLLLPTSIFLSLPHSSPPPLFHFFVTYFFTHAHNIFPLCHCCCCRHYCVSFNVWLGRVGLLLLQEDQDWGFVAMVLDRLFLWLFNLAFFLGTIAILLDAPALVSNFCPKSLGKLELCTSVGAGMCGHVQ